MCPGTLKEPPEGGTTNWMPLNYLVYSFSEITLINKI